jgi:L,D-transpeptidase YcbB
MLVVLAASGIARANDTPRGAPALPQYERLQTLLGTYRVLATQSWPTLPPLAPRQKIEAGDRYAGVPVLRDKLERLGDLAGATPAVDDGEIYSQDLAEAVRRFQFRHGLLVDGILGKETTAALNVPLAHRAGQIALSIERIRSLPELPPGPLIVVNIPSFKLAAFADSRDTARPALSMPVVVGRAFRNETPVFIGDMKYLEFGPFWNVPRNILRREILPRLERDPTYLAREDMEIVSTARGGAILSADDAAIAALHSGEARLRQRPGAKNAVGGVKFGLPNKMDIYLHATPATELFARTRRDFSHGCVRVRDPLALAQFVLAGRPEWTVEAIDAAMTVHLNRTVVLARPIPVVVFYATAFVDDQGRAHFLPDIYGHDRKLLQASRAS